MRIKILISSIFFYFSVFALMQSPESCLFKKEILKDGEGCFFGTLSKAESYKLSSGKLYIAANGILEKTDKVYVHTGLIVLDVYETLDFEVKNFKLKFEKGFYLLDVKSDLVKVEVSSGMALITSKKFEFDQKKSLKLTEGFQVELAVDEIRYGVVESIDIENHLMGVRNSEVFKAKEHFMSYAKNFKSKYKNYVLWSQDLHSQLFERVIAEEKESQDKKRRHERNLKIQKQRIKQSYINKVFDR